MIGILRTVPHAAIDSENEGPKHCHFGPQGRPKQYTREYENMVELLDAYHRWRKSNLTALQDKMERHCNQLEATLLAITTQ